uniref:Uncharacterized protein n=1 Tax=Steinernema glaseri TaxID=37863 RepID=A0A1I8A9E8_9BILA
MTFYDWPNVKEIAASYFCRSTVVSLHVLSSTTSRHVEKMLSNFCSLFVAHHCHKKWSSYLCYRTATAPPFVQDRLKSIIRGPPSNEPVIEAKWVQLFNGHLCGAELSQILLVPHIFERVMGWKPQRSHEHFKEFQDLVHFYWSFVSIFSEFFSRLILGTTDGIVYVVFTQMRKCRPGTELSFSAITSGSHRPC